MTVTFAADPTYTVTWVAGSNLSFSTQTSYAGTALTDPGTPGKSLCDNTKEFVGWTATPIVGEQNSAPADLFTSVSGMSIPATNTTYYAVFATATPTNNYKQITTEGALEAGKKYLIVGNSSTTYKALPVDAATDLTAVTPSSSTITTTTAAIIWTLEGSADAWKIKSTSNNKYLQISGGNLTFESSTTLTFSVGVSSSVFTFTSSASSGNKILSYYNGESKFNAYSKANTVYVYKQQINYTAYATTCSADPMLNVDPTTLNFGNVPVNGSKSLTFTLNGTNLTADATIAVTGAGYSVNKTSVAKDGSGAINTTVTVTYHPTTTGDNQAGTVTVSSTNADNKTVSLTGNSKATYSVSVSPTPSNGTVTSDKTSGIMADETVTLTITPSSGYVLSSISANSGAVTLNGSGNTRTFTMPAGNVTIAATFMERVDFVLVKDVNDLYDGATVVFCNNGEEQEYAKVIGAYNSGNNWPAVSASVFEEGGLLKILTTTPSMQTLTLGSGTIDNTWSFYDGTGYIYAANGTNGSNNYMKRQTTLDAKGSFTIAINTTTGLATITSQGDVNGRNKVDYNASGWFSCYSSTSTVYIYMIPNNCNKLAAPTGLSVSSITQNSVSLSWNAVANASSYNISCSGGTVEYTSGTSATVTGLTQGTTYTWSVQATGTGDYCALGTKANGNFTTKRAVKVTYNGNGHTGGQYPVTGGKVNLTEGDTYIILGNTGNGGAALTKTGYTWAGWHNSTTYSATPAYTVGEEITVTENIILYANWMPKRDTFIDGVHGTADQYGDGADYTIPSCADQARATSGDCEQKHYKFIGWALESADLRNPANIISAGGTRTATGATYYAVWGEEL